MIESAQDTLWTLFYFLALLVGILTGKDRIDKRDTRKINRRHR